MAKITIKELYYDDRYAIMREVAKAIEGNPLWASARDRDAIRELEIVRQTLIATEKMKQNGDCIAEEELGDAVTVSVYGGSDENN